MSLKVLCVCRHGNVRSVALAYLIKTIYGHDAIAIGIKETSVETRDMLYKWANKIIALDQEIYGEIMRETTNISDFPINAMDLISKIPNLNLILLDVGEDVWFNPYHHSLQHKLLKQINTLGL